MLTRQQLRAAERQRVKDLRKSAKLDSVTPRAAINRANSLQSTGPRTPEGKIASSGNSFKHGLYSTQLVIPGEDPAALDALKAGLRADHQPVNTTEEILVNEIAEHYWRIRRYRAMEPKLFDTDDPEKLHVAFTKLLPILQRVLTAAERGLNKSLTALRQLQKDRGFVPHIVNHRSPDNCEPAYSRPGFVPQIATGAHSTDNCRLTTAMASYPPKSTTSRQTEHATEGNNALTNNVSTKAVRGSGESSSPTTLCEY